MKLEFEHNKSKIVLDFDAAEGDFAFELRVNGASSLKKIKNGSIVWHSNDEMYLSKEAMSICDRMIKLIAFA